eukprot:770317-Amphidinium_carterae.1
MVHNLAKEEQKAVLPSRHAQVRSQTATDKLQENPRQAREAGSPGGRTGKLPQNQARLQTPTPKLSMKLFVDVPHFVTTIPPGFITRSIPQTPKP